MSSFATVPTQGPIIGVFNQPIRDDLGWSATDIALAFVIGTVAGGFMSAVVGKILDRRGARAVATISGVIIALTMIGLSRMQEPWHFWIFFGIARATAASGAQLSVMVSLASWFVRMRGRAVGFIGTGQRTAQAIMPLPLVAIMGWLSWREAWLVLGVLVVLLLVIPSAVLLRRRPEEFGLLPDGRDSDGQSGSELEDASEKVEVTYSLVQAKRTRQLWFLILGNGGVILSLNATNLHMTAHLQDNGLSLALAATVTTIFAATGALTVLPWGFALEHIHVRYVGLTSTSLLVVAMLLLVSASSFVAGVVFGLTYGLAIGAWTVTSRMLFANYFGRQHFGSIRGFAARLMVLANPAGPLLAAQIRDRMGSFDAVFYIFAGVFVVSFLSFLIAVPLREPPGDAPKAA
jgi:sugar phosphate permease